MKTTTKTNWQDINTADWYKVQFLWKGYRLESSIAQSSPLLPQIKALPQGLFEKMNIEALDALVKPKESITKLLDRVNEGATHAIISLA